MTDQEKAALCQQISEQKTDWDTAYNSGRNEGLKVAISIIENLKTDHYGGMSLEFLEMRKDSGKTLREVEAGTGISNPYLSQLETGKIVNPSFEVVYKLNFYYSNLKNDGQI